MRLRYVLLLIILILLALFSAIFPIYPEPDSQTTSKIQEAVDQARVDNDIPGMQVSISLPTHRNGVKYVTQNFLSGVRALNSTIPVRPEDLYQIGSNTKAFVAVVLLQLEAEGRLNINDPISKYLSFKNHPTWPKRWEKVTIKQLLNMTSRIYNYTEADGFFRNMLDHPSEIRSPTYLVNIAAQHDDYKSGWAYSNTNYILLGMIIEAVSKKSVEENITARILKPLKLSNTYYSPGDYPQKIDDQTVNGYWRYLSTNNNLKDVTNINLSYGRAAGAMLSNTHDMVRWIRALYGNNNSYQVLQDKQRKELTSLVCDPRVSPTTVCVPGDPTTPQIGGFGLGVAEMYKQSYGEIWWYTGETLGHMVSYLWIPEKDTVICVAGNVARFGSTHQYTLILALNILQILYPSGSEIT